MTRSSCAHTLLAAAVAVAAALVAATPVAAQSAPVSVAKRAATNAVQATNRHTAAMTNTGADTSAARATTPASGPSHGTPSRGAGTTSHPAQQPASQKPASQKPAAAASHAAPTSAAGPKQVAAKPGTPPASARAQSAAAQHPVGDSARETSIADRGGRAEFAIERETFAYTRDGRRDPFLSLMATGELRPMLDDLVLTAIVYDPNGNSVAVLRDRSSDDQYRVKNGQQLGRMRVAAIRQKSIVFTIEEYGYSRQEVLALNDSNTERKK
ncbi:MAG TPA: hypothetical protein VFK13_02450 [Gemmatimonadaceae bacterium]|nr:hypothetical protein [Gemmatimonadaceae bacterium]